MQRESQNTMIAIQKDKYASKQDPAMDDAQEADYK